MKFEQLFCASLHSGMTLWRHDKQRYVDMCRLVLKIIFQKLNLESTNLLLHHVIIAPGQKWLLSTALSQEEVEDYVCKQNYSSFMSNCVQ